MENREVVDLLNSLIKLDVDAVGAYEQAIKEVDIAGVRERMSTFRQDHERHILDLQRVVRDLGGVPAEHKKDLKGYLIEGFTAIRSKMGPVGALRAMQTNEQLTNRRYNDARNKGVSGQARVVIDRNYEDERRHLEFIETTIREHT